MNSENTFKCLYVYSNDNAHRLSILEQQSFDNVVFRQQYDNEINGILFEENTPNAVVEKIPL